MGYTKSVSYTFTTLANLTSYWENDGGSNVTVTSNQLNLAAVASYPYILSLASYDLRTSIFAYKWNAGSGTATASTTFTLGARDTNGNEVNITCTPDNTYSECQGIGNAVISDGGANEYTGTAQANGTWIGFGMMQADSVLHVYRSSDGVNWTEWRSVNVSGVFGKTSVKIKVGAGFYTTGESPTWKSNIPEIGVFTVAYNKTVFDDFSGSFNSDGRWITVPADTGNISVSGGTLLMTAIPAYTKIQTPANFDVTQSFWAVQVVGSSGTVTSSCQFQMQLTDTTGSGSNNGVMINYNPSTLGWNFSGQGGVSVFNPVYSANDNTGHAWPANTWIGIGNIDESGLVHVYKSTDTGTTWSEIGSCQYSGTFNKTAVSFSMQAGYYDTTQSPTYKAAIGPVAKITLNPLAVGGAKVRVGGAWVDATVKVRVGGAWVAAVPKRRVGGAWV